VESEERYGIAVLRSLDVEPVTASKVDLSRAISDGRRRQRIRRWSRVGAAAAVTAVAVAAVPLVSGALAKDAPDAGPPVAATADPTPAAATPPTSCTVSRLPVPGGHPMALVTGADPTGRLLLGRAYPEGDNGGKYPVVIWDNGVPRTVDVPGIDQSLKDANSAGVAVGSGWVGAGPVPYVYLDGKVSKLGGVASGEAIAINEAGVIVGQRTSGEEQVPVVWPSATEPAKDLPLPDGYSYGTVVAVGEDGSVVGVLHDDKLDKPNAAGVRGGNVAYLWSPNGTGRLLAKPADGEYFRPYSITNNSAYGLAQKDDEKFGGARGAFTPVRLDLTTGEYTRLPAASMFPSEANSSGWLVGSTGQGRAVFYTGRGLMTLPDLDNHKSSTANIATTVSEDGRVVGGQGDDANGVIQPVVWRCR
jgi:hypothetical protein